MMGHSPQSTHILKFAWPGFCALLVGIGIGRYGFPPLMPDLVAAGWFDETVVIHLNAVNLAGYVFGSIVATRFVPATWTVFAVRLSMVLVVVCFAADIWPLPIVAAMTLRAVSGIAGGLAMVLVVPQLLSATSAASRGRVSGLAYLGAGIGIIGTGALVPALGRYGPEIAWAALATACLVLTVAGWNGWPSPPAAEHGASDARLPPGALASHSVLLLTAAYGLNAIGTVPHTVFVTVFVTRQLGEGPHVAGWAWVVFGIGACVGSVAAGIISDQLGASRTLKASYAVKAVAVMIPLVAPDLATVLVSCFLVGALTPGVVTLASTLVADLYPGGAAATVWGLMTMAFAVTQAVAAHAIAGLFAATGSYDLVFATGGGALWLALACQWLARAGNNDAGEGRDEIAH